MILTTVDGIPGKEMELLGIVQGTTVQSVNVLKDFGSGFKSLVGGELKNYNEMMNNARSLAVDRMVKSAKNLDADAVIGVRYTTSSIMQGAAEILVYGTAVKFL